MKTTCIPFALLLLALLAGCRADKDYVDRMAEEHANDTPRTTAMASGAAASVSADTVHYATVDGRQVTGYLAEPARPDSVLQARGLPPEAQLPGLIVIHEWWGLNDNIRQMTRRLAGEGYRALAVDLYGGEVAGEPARARELMQQAMDRPEMLLTTLQAAYAFLNEQERAGRVGVIGWCFGGTMSLRLALALPETLDAAVIYYGHVGSVEREALEPLSVPVLGLFGGKDQGIPVENVRRFEQMLDEMDKQAEIHIYEEAGHAFANPSGGNYVEEAARDAWNKTVTFLNEHLYH